MQNFSQLVLSLFPNIGLLDKGFEEHGFCVVKGPEKFLGGDIRNFTPIANRFDGVIGGSPCQDFSVLRRTEPTGNGIEMLGEFGRVVLQSNCDWFLLENVPAVPDIVIDGYYIQRFSLSPNDLGFEQSRRRHFQFGSKYGYILDIEKQEYSGKKERCLTATEGKQQDRRTWKDFLLLQGLPLDFELEGFTREARYRAVGNGVHVGVAKEIARLIKKALLAETPKTFANYKTCPCGCGAVLTGKQKASSATCRKRLEMLRKNPKTVNVPVSFAPAFSH
ncbi:DNA cytosine methyltransferase [Emticicia fontis]